MSPKGGDVVYTLVLCEACAKDSQLAWLYAVSNCFRELLYSRHLFEGDGMVEISTSLLFNFFHCILKNITMILEFKRQKATYR